MKEAFERIYRDGIWGAGSGTGSLVGHAGPYLKTLAGVLRRERIRSVVDIGCGDWQLGAAVNWDGIDYTGVDVVPSIVDDLTRRFARPGIRFLCRDALVDALPPADLLIIKDVLQHWSNASIHAALAMIEGSPLALVTNGISPRGATLNRDVADGGCRPLDLRAPPFDRDWEEIIAYAVRDPSRCFASFGRPWFRKSVLLHRSPNRFAQPIRMASASVITNGSTSDTIVVNGRKTR